MADEAARSDQATGVEIAVTTSTHIEVELTDCGGTTDGIDICVNGHDAYTISPLGARQLSRALDEAADRRGSS